MPEGGVPHRRPGASDQGLAGEVREDLPADLGAAGCVQLELVDPAVLLDVGAARSLVNCERQVRGRCPRSCGLLTCELRKLDALSGMLLQHFPHGATFFTGTFAPDYEWPPYTPSALFKDTKRFLKGALWGGERVLVAEPHKWRDVLHVHGLLAPSDVAGRHRLGVAWYEQRGLSRVLPASAGAFPYVCKYAFKGSDRCLADRRPVTRHTPGADWVDFSGLRPL